MKSLFRLGIVVIIAVLALAPALGVKAQGSSCTSSMGYGLPDADLKLFCGAFDQANLAKFTSFVMDYNLALKVTGAPQGDVNVSVQGNGPFAVDAAAMSSGSSSNPMAAMTAIQAANTIKASASGGGQNMAGTLEWRITGGNLYFMGDMATQGKWEYISLSDAMTAAMTRFSSMSSGSGSTSGPGSMFSGASTAFQDPSVQAALAAIPTIPGFIKATAADGAQVDGVATRQITYTFDFVTLVKAPQFLPVIKALAKSSGQGGADLTDAQAQQFAGIAATALAGSNFSVDWLVGTTDNLIHGFGINIAVHLDPTTVAMFSGGAASSGGAAKAIDVSFVFNVTLSKVGQPETVQAPTGATQIDISGMMGSGSGPAPAATTAK